MRKGDKNDPKGLILEAYKIDGITVGECRSIFLDWVLGIPLEKDTQLLIQSMLTQYETSAPDHPMTETLRKGLITLASPRRRGGWRGRPRGKSKIS